MWIHDILLRISKCSSVAKFSLFLSWQTRSSPLERYAHINYNAALKVSHAIRILLETGRSLPNPPQALIQSEWGRTGKCSLKWVIERKFSLMSENRAQGDRGDSGKCRIGWGHTREKATRLKKELGRWGALNEKRKAGGLIHVKRDVLILWPTINHILSNLVFIVN